MCTVPYNEQGQFPLHTGGFHAHSLRFVLGVERLQHKDNFAVRKESKLLLRLLDLVSSSSAYAYLWQVWQKMSKDWTGTIVEYGI